MSKYIITISRQFGSMGKTIAARMSEILDIEFLDKSIVEETTRRMGFPVYMPLIKGEDSRDSFSRGVYPMGMKTSELKEEIFNVQRNIIRDFADKNSCIIVGRCADYILKDYDNVLSIYVYAPVQNRVNNCIEILGLSEKDSLRMIKDVDLAREKLHRQYNPNYESPFTGRDICIDSSSFGIDGTAEILSNIAKNKFMY